MELIIVLFMSYFIINVQASQSNDGYGITDRYINVDHNTPGADNCYKNPSCDAASKYRTIDGSCNNLNNPTWGATNTTFLRLLPASYQDGNHEIRKGKYGKDLPNVRLISRTLYPDIYVPDKANSLAVMQWGQVISHDAASTLFPLIYDECCPNGTFPDQPYPKCDPISVPPGDHFYSQYNVTCLPYSRVTTLSEAQKCTVTPQQPSTGTSHWLDLSLVYGNSNDESKSVRGFNSGKLKVEMTDGEETLPVTHESQSACIISSPKQSCLVTGDYRVNQSPDNGVLALVMTREHNRLAEELSKQNPAWNDEKLYQEARRINIAVAQHITYSEYLENVLDKKYINGMKLAPLKSGFTEYNAKMRGGTINEFTGSIFRTFHSTLQGDLKLIGGGNGKCPMKEAKLGDYWMTSGDIVLQCFEELAMGLMVQQARLYHNHFTNQETEYLNKLSKPYGNDMESIDMMRGRDLGFPSYNQFRKVCELSTFTSFQDLATVMDQKVISKLSELYDSVEDIDLFVGAIFEKPVSPGLTGPLAQCVMAQQFARLKFPDRFYFEHKDQTGSFSSDQLNEIKKMTFSSLMCRNTKIKRIQKKGFYQASDKNEVVSCSEIPTVNISFWKE